jgi:uncharacterized membrane protein YfcA
MVENNLFYVLAVIAILIAGIAKSGFGGGLGVLSVPLMSLVISPPKAAAIMLPLLCIMDIFNLWQYRKSWDRKNLQILIPAAMIGILGGMLFFRYLSDAVIRLLVGVIALAFVLSSFYKGRYGEKKEANMYRGGFWGSIAGFTSFGVHGGGPPIDIYLLPQRLNKSIFVGTKVILFTIVNYIKLIPYAWLGQLNCDNLLTSLILSPLAPVGVLLGIRLHRTLNQNLFYTICYFILFITGVKLVFDGLVNL